jgi:uncharacterized membrane protein
VSESGSEAPRSPEAPPTTPPRSIRPVLRGVLLDIAPPLTAYYGLRALGQSEYVALLSATVLSGLKVTYDAIKARRLDPFAGYLLLTFGLSLAVGLATSDPKLLLSGNTLVNGIGALIFLGSYFVGTPLTRVVAERVHPAGDESDPDDEGLRRRLHVLLSAMWGTSLLVEVGVRLVVISKLSVDAANGVNTVISLSTVGLLFLATVVIARRATARWAIAG